MAGTSIYRQVTEKILNQLQQGVLPWRKPWEPVPDRNAFSGRPYRGVNVLLLNISALVNGFTSPYWLTYREAKKLGGYVRKGEKATSIIFWKVLEVVEKDSNGNPIVNPETGEERTVEVPFARYYMVFNLEQTEGVTLPDKLQCSCPPAEGICSSLLSLPTIKWGKSATYDPERDFIELPPSSSFHSQDAFWSSFFHELIHWTGKRLGREFGHRFGDKAYAFEELVAEIGSAFLCAHAGIEADGPEHASYIQEWINILERDSKAIFTAARKAQEAVDWLLACVAEEKKAEAA